MEIKQIFDFKVMINIGEQKKLFEYKTCSSRLGIMGPSGGGKSSLAKMIAGIQSSQIERLIFKDIDFNDLAPWERNIGYLPQDIQLLPHLSVEKNLLFPKAATLDIEIIKNLGLSTLLNRMPRNLSGGEKQRVGLARTLMTKPQLLILDEPFSSLDKNTKNNVMVFLDNYLMIHNIPLIIISHGEDELNFMKCAMVSI